MGGAIWHHLSLQHTVIFFLCCFFVVQNEIHSALIIVLEHQHMSFVFQLQHQIHR